MGTGDAEEKFDCEQENYCRGDRKRSEKKLDRVSARKQTHNHK